MDLLVLEETLDRLAKVNGMRWSEQVLRRDDHDLLRRTLYFEVVGKRQCGQSKMTWRRQVQQIGLTKSRCHRQNKVHKAVYELSRNIR